MLVIKNGTLGNVCDKGDVSKIKKGGQYHHPLFWQGDYITGLHKFCKHCIHCDIKAFNVLINFVL